MLDLYEGTIDHDYYYPATEVKDTKAIVMDKIKEIETKDLINFYLHSKSNESEWSYGSKGLDIELLKYEVNKFFMGLATVDNESIRYGHIKFLKNQILKKTKDSYDIFYPKNCKVEQVAIYKDNMDKLYINSVIEAETNGTTEFDTNGKLVITISNFTNGASGFKETLKCSNRIKIGK